MWWVLVEGTSASASAIGESEAVSSDRRARPRPRSLHKGSTMPVEPSS